MDPLSAVGALMDQLVAWAEGLGLWAVLILTYVDSLGLPATGDAALLIWAGLREQPLLLVMLVAFVGGAAGDSTAYWAGRIVGSRLVRRFASEEREARWTAYLHRHAAKALIGTRMIAALRTKVAVLAGAARYPYPRFLAYNLIGCAIWAVSFGLLGRLVGDVVGVTGVMHQIGVVALVGIGIVVALAILQRYGLPWLAARRAAARR